ncbi:MAG: T9SS type A sorting domain-containing protein, partial [Bacteroidia bacterium]|nr:T9SS type A sorting domain-containing protein [Bacteroidia bacterium]
QHFMYIANCKRFEHGFNNAGHYNVSLTAYNSDNTAANTAWMGFDIVDCSTEITNPQLSGSTYVDWNNILHFWAGRYELSSFYSSYNNSNVHIGACDEIVLNDGVTIEPAVGKEIVFYIDECLQGSNNKDMPVVDDYKPQHETKCLTSEQYENIIKNSINGVILYPNPNNGIFMLSFTAPETKIRQFEIFNSLGELILKYNNVAKSNYLIDISKNNCGIYYVKILYENKSDVFKVVYSIVN